jgi:hypothetical protein
MIIVAARRASLYDHFAFPNKPLARKVNEEELAE